MNKKMRMKFVAVMAMGLLAMGSLAGCSSPGKTESTPGTTEETKKEETKKEEPKKDEKPVELVWWTIGNEPKELDAVNEAINEYTKEKLNVTLDIRYASWGDYGEKLSKIVQSGESYDIAFGAGITGYQDLANKGYFADLTPYLDETPNLKQFIPEALWQGMTVNGEIFGVPAYKDSAQAQYWIWQQPVVEELGIDITQMKTLQDLDPVLRKMKEAYPTKYPLMLQANEGINGFIAMICKYDELLVSPYVTVGYEDESATVVSPWEQENTMENLKMLHTWFKDGLINPDAATITENPKGRMISAAQGFPHAWTEADGVPVVYEKFYGPAFSTRTIQGSFLSVSAGSKNIDKALKVIELVNTDEKMRNLLAFGIEGVHYEKTGDTSIKKLNDGYETPAYSQGTFFNMYTVDPAPASMWQDLKAETETAISSPALGFTFNTQSVQNQIAACANIQSKYQPSLITGAANPEEIVPQMMEELNKAGYQEIIAEAQKQLNEYLGK
nr:ABC transporter substrate-binding protein [uncultured Niameybacter sp.]